MPIQGFQPEEFSKNLAQQAVQLVPQDLSEEHKQYVVNKVYQFCTLAGNALNQDESIELNSEQACTITQYIGEWTFHKSIDVIRAGVPEACRDPVLQQVAFAVFEAAKVTQIDNLDPGKALELVEKEVSAAYQKALQELAQSGQLDPNTLPSILKQSNIDKMAQENAQAVAQAKNQKIDYPDLNPVVEEKEKIHKFGAIALLLKSLSPEKAEMILNKFPKGEMLQIRHFMEIPYLEKKLDIELATQYLNEFKKKLPEILRPEIYKQMDNIHNLSNFYTVHEIKEAINMERPKIIEFVAHCMKDNRPESLFVSFSPYIATIIFNHIKSKLTA